MIQNLFSENESNPFAYHCDNVSYRFNKSLIWLAQMYLYNIGHFRKQLSVTLKVYICYESLSFIHKFLLSQSRITFKLFTSIQYQSNF